MKMTKKDRTKARRAKKPAMRRAVKRQRREKQTEVYVHEDGGKHTGPACPGCPKPDAIGGTENSKQATAGAAPHDGTGAPVEMECGCDDGQHEATCPQLMGIVNPALAAV